MKKAGADSCVSLETVYVYVWKMNTVSGTYIYKHLYICSCPALDFLSQTCLSKQNFVCPQNKEDDSNWEFAHGNKLSIKYITEEDNE